MGEQSLVELLRMAKLEWELDLEKLAAITHVPEDTLSQYLNAQQEEGAFSVPAGLSSAVAFASIYQKLKKRYPNTEDQLNWLFSEQKDFGQNKPIDIIAQSPQDLLWVSYYLDSAN